MSWYEQCLFGSRVGNASIRNDILEAMLPYYSEHFANPSTFYNKGSEIRQVVEEQRAKVADLIGADAAEIIFTSSGAEANNLAIKGEAFVRQKKGQHIIVSSIEHHSVLNSARFLERLDFEVSFLPVDGYGVIDPNRLTKVILAEQIDIIINTYLSTNFK